MNDPGFIDSRGEMEQVLQEEVLGCLGLAGNGQPYGMPRNYAYAAGKILCHCALTGQTLDAIHRNPRCSAKTSARSRCQLLEPVLMMESAQD